MPKKPHNHPTTELTTAKQEKVPRPVLWVAAPSLRPGKAHCEANAEGVPTAKAITAAWAFRAPVVRLSPQDYEALVARCSVSFGG